MRKIEFFLILISIFSFVSNNQKHKNYSQKHPNIKTQKNEYRFECDITKGFYYKPKQYSNELKCLCKKGYSFFENVKN